MSACFFSSGDKERLKRGNLDSQKSGRNSLVRTMANSNRTEPQRLYSDLDLVLAQEELIEEKVINGQEQKTKLLAKVEDMRLGGDLEVAWVERLDHTLDEQVDVGDVKDDFVREARFYEQALAAVKEGLARLDRAGVKHKRPDDYFAEMLKTDMHMKKVRAKLIEQKKGIEQQQERRKIRDMKKFGKQLQIQKTLERAKQKKKELDSIKKWRQDRKKGNNEDGEFPAEVLLAEDAPEKNNKKKSLEHGKGRNADQPSNRKRKRQAAKKASKDAKYGFGGKKRHKKSNDAESTSDVSSYNQIRNTQYNQERSKNLRGAVRGRGGGRGRGRGGKRG